MELTGKDITIFKGQYGKWFVRGESVAGKRWMMANMKGPINADYVIQISDEAVSEVAYLIGEAGLGINDIKI